MSIRNARLLLALTGVLIACTAGATTYSDNFQYNATNQAWKALGNACLTSSAAPPPPGGGHTEIPVCGNTFQNGASYTIPADEKVGGQGALLLTPPNNNQTGAILSAFAPFPLTQGIQITFTTYTYGGDSGGTANNGADGIVFFLTDGTKYASDGKTPLPTTTGAEGGSMGYDCSNDNGVYDGIAYGYLGLGIDEYGNFLNSGDNGSAGIYNSRNKTYGTTAYGDNSYQNNVNGSINAGSGPQYQPERIGLRGAGNTNWAWLQSQNSDYYSGSSSASKVQAACSSGQYVSGGKGSRKNPYTYANIPYNYNPIPGGYAILPNSEPIANNSKSATRNPTASTKSSNIAWPITYKLSISAGGLLNFAYSYNNGAFQPVLVNSDITASNGPLPASLRFGFSAGTGGSNNVHEITCFQASPLQANSSAGSNTVTGKVTGNSQFFLASYSSDNWWGSLVADPLVIESDGTLNIGTAANWDAKCVLTGATPCDTMTYTDPVTGTTTTHNVAVQSPSSRNLFTWNSAGVTLNWTNLSTAEQTALNTNTSGTVDNQGQQRVQWLQGVRSVEQLQKPTPGSLRARNYVLGDIINSSPTFVGAPGSGALPDAFYDQLNPSASNPENATGAQKFSGFVSSNASRINVVYVGGNDGFMHGFEAGIGGNGKYGATDNDGKELLGYIPYDVLMNKAVKLADPLYTHDYLVDATPVAGDVFYGSKWHTWLVGGVGSNGQEIYALDVTKPSSFSASNVIGDWDSSTLTHLGNTVGTPIIARMHNGQWAIIFGSGLHTDNNGNVINNTTAGVYIGLIDKTTGTVTFQFLDTGVGSKTSPDGIAYVSQVDLDGDHIADYLYAGDTQGNVWRFDVTGNTASQWKVSTFGGGSPTPLFVAKDASGNVQPITTSITILAVQTGLVTRDMLYFGTGRQTQATASQGVQYAKGTSSSKTAQTFYGIWDWDMSNWNNMSTIQYASLGSGGVTRSNLLVQTLAANPDPSDLTHRYLDTTKVVCWQGDAVTTQCPTENQYGWLFDLPDPGSSTGEWAGEGEQVIYNPAFIDGAVVVNTAIPPEISASQCNPGLQSGWTMAFDPSTGGGFPEGYFPDQGGGFGSSGSGSVGGTMVSGVGTPTAIEYGGKNYLVTQTITGGAKLFPINPPSNDNPSRVSWRELVNP